MRIAVILPPPATKPIGGYKIIYHYCDLLCSLKPSLKIDIYYVIHLFYKQKKPVRNILKKLYYSTIKSKFHSWFNFNNKNVISHHIGVDRIKLMEFDLIFVSNVKTAFLVYDMKLDVPVIYFIQGFEDWTLNKKLVYQTYNMGYLNVVVSKWLKDILVEHHSKVALHLPNPVDDLFEVDIPIQMRPLRSILFMYHEAESKGSKEALGTVSRLRKIFPEIKVSCFSGFRKPDVFPTWIDYHYSPSREELKELMNEHFIFLSTSYKEGYGLPPAEAMACGCCVVTTDSGGVGDFAVDGETAFVASSPPIPDELAAVIVKIIDNPDQACRIAMNGKNRINQFNWNDNTKKLTDLISQANQHE